MIPLKILTQACAEIITEQPEKTDSVIASLDKMLSRYGKVRRASVIEQIIEQVARKLNVKRYRVISADTLSQSSQEQITETIGNANSDIAYTVNTQLLGGIVVKTKDKVLDLSLKNKIEKIKKIISS